MVQDCPLTYPDYISVSVLLHKSLLRGCSELRRVDIVIGHDGEKWIHTERVKTETATRVPLLPQAIKIMDAYKDHPQCVNQGKLLPVLSNAKMNEYLKEIADRCEIN